MCRYAKPNGMHSSFESSYSSGGAGASPEDASWNVDSRYNVLCYVLACRLIAERSSLSQCSDSAVALNKAQYSPQLLSVKGVHSRETLLESSNHCPTDEHHCRCCCHDALLQHQALSAFFLL